MNKRILFLVLGLVIVSLVVTAYSRPIDKATQNGIVEIIYATPDGMNHRMLYHGDSGVTCLSHCGGGESCTWSGCEPEPAGNPTHCSQPYECRELYNGPGCSGWCEQGISIGSTAVEH